MYEHFIYCGTEDFFSYTYVLFFPVECYEEDAMAIGSSTEVESNTNPVDVLLLKDESSQRWVSTVAESAEPTVTITLQETMTVMSVLLKNTQNIDQISATLLDSQGNEVCA